MTLEKLHSNSYKSRFSAPEMNIFERHLNWLCLNSLGYKRERKKNRDSFQEPITKAYLNKVYFQPFLKNLFLDLVYLEDIFLSD